MIRRSNPVIFLILTEKLNGRSETVSDEEYNKDEYGSPDMYSQDQYNEASEKSLSSSNDEDPKKIVEDVNSETSALEQHDESDLDAVKNKGRKYNE